jgi:UDP-N-acetylmuramoylalanine--D-glutamate ligase
VDSSFDVAVLEVSSFQLERAPTFRPRASILLNISEDHLDRYASFADYAAAKGNAFVNQTADDVAIVELSDVRSSEQAARGAGRLVSFGAGPADYAVSGSRVVERSCGRALDFGSSALHGRHNWLNAAAAVAATRVFTDDWSSLEQATLEFEPLPHRMHRVATLDGVNFYDDSKGTNVGAAVTALSGLVEPKAVLIAGGRDKQGAYEPLVDVLRVRGRALVVLGEAAPRIRAAAEGALPIVRVQSMREAVERARELAQSGDAVLLSPACSSFDMYRSYAERGDDFQRIVRGLSA